MKSILMIKHWQIFIIILIGAVLYNFKIEGNTMLSMYFTIAGTIIYSLWPMLVGNELNQLLPKRITLNFNFFLINTFIWLVVFIGILVLSNGEGMTFTGLSVLPLFYAIFAYFYFLAYPAKVLNSIEREKEASLGQYIGDFFLILFLPIGIWFLQPRINRILQKEKIGNLEELNNDN